MSSVAGVSSTSGWSQSSPGDAECPPDGRCGGQIAASSVGAMTSSQATSRLERLADLTYGAAGGWSSPGSRSSRPPSSSSRSSRGYWRRVRHAGEREQSNGRPAREALAGSSGETVNVVWEAPVGARRAQDRIDRLLAEAERVDGVAGASEPRYSRDGTIGLVQLRLERSAMDLETSSGTRLIDWPRTPPPAGLRVEVGGGLVEAAQEGQPPELMGLLAAAVILLIAFGSVIAARLPLLLAIFGLGLQALIGIVALLVDTPDFAPAVAGLIRIGVRIDYSLLILTRFRSAMLAGANGQDALVEHGHDRRAAQRDRRGRDGDDLAARTCPSGRLVPVWGGDLRRASRCWWSSSPRSPCSRHPLIAGRRVDRLQIRPRPLAANRRRRLPLAGAVWFSAEPGSAQRRWARPC